MKKHGPLFLAFLAGILVGSSLAWRFVEHKKNEWRNPEQRHQKMVKLLSRKLDLTPDQKEKLVKILNDKREKMDALHKEFHPQFESLRNGIKDEIRAILLPKQIEKYNALEARWETRRKKRHGPPTS